MTAASALTVEHLTVNYRDVQALRNLSFTIQPGQLVGILGPNGAGKSTLIKAMLGLLPPVTGRVTYGEDSLAHQLDRVAYVPQRSQIDWSFPATVWDVVMMARVKQTGWLRPFSPTSRQAVKQALERVGLADLSQRPLANLSGGQQQRVAIARALITRPQLIICDEPVSMLDATVQTQVLDLMLELRQEFNLTYLFITHDLWVARFLCDRIAVMQAGKVVELALTERLFNSPQHPYTRRLLEAAPVLNRRAS